MPQLCCCLQPFVTCEVNDTDERESFSSQQPWDNSTTKYLVGYHVASRGRKCSMNATPELGYERASFWLSLWVKYTSCSLICVFCCGFCPGTSCSEGPKPDPVTLQSAGECITHNTASDYLLSDLQVCKQTNPLCSHWEHVPALLWHTQSEERL